MSPWELGGLVPKEEIDRVLKRMEEEGKRRIYPSCPTCQHKVCVGRSCMYRCKPAFDLFDDYCDLDLEYEGEKSFPPWPLREKECRRYEQGDKQIIILKKVSP
jgi:hypothetical protein